MYNAFLLPAPGSRHERLYIIVINSISLVSFPTYSSYLQKWHADGPGFFGPRNNVDWLVLMFFIYF